MGFDVLSCLQASVGLVISLLLLVDLSLTLLMLLQFYSISLAAMLGILMVLPFASVIPSAAGLNALFSHGPRRSAALARIYALWNITSFVNLVSYPHLSVFLSNDHLSAFMIKCKSNLCTVITEIYFPAFSARNLKTSCHDSEIVLSIFKLT